jgi:peptidoglycan/LPS O-acetylase OafA/YrhL
MRGVAAIAVVLVHIPELFSINKPWSCGLAVDLFFLLSGFVIEHAYGSELQQGLSFKEFFRRRMARLYPVYLLGLLLYSTFFLVRRDVSADLVLLDTALAVLYLPSPGPVSFDANFAFPVNPVSWSLFCELVVNFAYALFFPRERALVLLVLLSALALIFEQLLIKPGGPWEFLLSGIVRASFSFFVGILIKRRMSRRTTKAPSWLALLILAGIFSFTAQPNIQPYYELAIIFFAFPALVIFAATTNDQSRLMFGIYDRLGALSYPNYVFHMPVILWVSAIIPRMTGYHLLDFAPWVGFAIVGTIAVIAYNNDRRYDEPLRRYLKRRRGLVLRL